MLVALAHRSGRDALFGHRKLLSLHFSKGFPFLLKEAGPLLHVACGRGRDARAMPACVWGHRQADGGRGGAGGSAGRRVLPSGSAALTAPTAPRAAAELAQTRARGLKSGRSLFSRLVSNAERVSVQRETRRVLERILEIQVLREWIGSQVQYRQYGVHSSMIECARLISFRAGSRRGNARSIRFSGK